MRATLSAATWFLVLVVTAVTVAAVTATLTRVPAPTRTVVTVAPTASVLRAVQSLARLETVSFHMERVIDLRESQSRMFGLIEAEDAILLVAAADVVAGVDLARLRPEDVSIDARTSRVTLTLPRAEVFATHLDAEHTFVHSRSTDTLAVRQENLETRARQEAERSLREAALRGGILTRAEENAGRTVTWLLRALGHQDVVLRWR